MKQSSGAQALDVPPEWQFVEHQHPDIEVVGVLQGQMVLTAADRLWWASKRQLLVVPPHLPHSWRSTDAGKVSVLHVARFSQDFVGRLLPNGLPLLISLAEAQWAEYEALFLRLVAMTEPQQIRLLRAYLEAFLLALLEGWRGQHSTRVAMHDVASYMHAHQRQPLTIVQVAHQFLMSEVTLRRRFREALGISPKQYLLELRLCEARHLLTTTDLSMQEIALRTGFFDLAHFSSTFRKQYGLTPSGWRARSIHHPAT